jgi:mannonate dehydratase
MHLMHQTMRWYGPNDIVPLAHIRQAGCVGVVTALHHIAVGEVWPLADITARKQLVEAAGMTWTVVESLPVSEAIKTQTGHYELHIENYQQSLRNLASCGIKVITYNFMPILDWLRTNVSYPLPSGAKALYFERLAFVAFDVFMLKRPGAENDYHPAELAQAERRYAAMTHEEKQDIFRNTMLGLPGSDEAFTPERVLAALHTYAHIDAAKLKAHLFYFLEQVVPVAEALGLKLAIHPDDPPYSVLGLPRVVSTEQDAADLIAAAPSAANGLCFCTGSFGARPDNNISAMVKRFGPNIHFLHLRNTKRDAEGNFYEADHLGGDTDMYAVVSEVFRLQQAHGISLPMRPDHGHQMLDDLQKTTYPGYSAIGRLKGLAELRGLEYAIAKSAGL